MKRATQNLSLNGAVASVSRVTPGVNLAVVLALYSFLAIGQAAEAVPLPLPLRLPAEAPQAVREVRGASIKPLRSRRIISLARFSPGRRTQTWAC